MLKCRFQPRHFARRSASAAGPHGFPRAAVSFSLWLDALLFLWLNRYLCRVPDSNYKNSISIDLIKKSIRQHQQFAVG